MEIRGLPAPYPLPPRAEPASRGPGEPAAENRAVPRPEGRARPADHQLDYRQTVQGARRSQGSEKEDIPFREVYEDRTPPQARRALSAYAENAGSEVPEELVGVDTYV